MEMYSKVFFVCLVAFLTWSDPAEGRKKASSGSKVQKQRGGGGKLTLGKLVKQLKVKDTQIKNLYRRLNTMETQQQQLIEDNKVLSENQKLLMEWKDQAPWRQLALIEDLTKEIKAEQTVLIHNELDRLNQSSSPRTNWSETEGE